MLHHTEYCLLGKAAQQKSTDILGKYAASVIRLKEKILHLLGFLLNLLLILGMEVLPPLMAI
jgi:hypothetical protein